jgi:hypothetical protein
MKLTENEKYLLIKLHCKIEQAKFFTMQGFDFDYEAFRVTMEIEGIKKEFIEENIENLIKKGYVNLFKYRIEITEKGYNFIKKYCY